jgi:ABC-type branched-subunit amino acid transport system substrate-binding protein
MKKWRLSLHPILIALILPVILTVMTAESGLSREPILLGQSCALSGPAKNLGLELRAGLLAAFSKRNDEGGVQGRDVLLISKDDGYEPDRAIKNIQNFIEKQQVFMIIGQVGTPTSKAVIPIIEKHHVPFFAPFSGAEFLREPFRKYVINVRASYFQEMERLVSYLIDEKNISRIACFYQNDSYGLDGLQGIRLALRRRGMELVSQGTYERNTVAVMGGLRDVHKGDPEAIILVGAYSACAEFIKLSKVKKSGKRIYCNISFVGTESLKKALGYYGDDVIISQVVPHPGDTSIPLIKEYIEAMKKYQHDMPISFISLEGYIAGKLFSEIASRVQGELSRESFVDTMETIGHFDLGGLTLKFGENDHQGMDKIYLTRIMPTIQVIDASVQ